MVAAAAAALASGEEEREREGTVWRLGARGAVPTGVSRSASGASTTPAYGRHMAGVRWSKTGTRVRERGGGNWAARLGSAEREAVGPAAPAPFSFFFFFNFFSPKSSNKICEAFANHFRGWSKKKKGSPQNFLQFFFNM